MAGNYGIPRSATLIEDLFGVTHDDADGDDSSGDQAARCKIWRHVREGHARPEFYVLQYAYQGRRINRVTRVASRLSGATAQARLEAELTVTRPAFEQSRIRAAARAARVLAAA